MPERADYIPPLTRFDCMQPDPMEGLVCKRCEGSGEIDRELLGDLAVSVESCPDCGGTGRP